MTKISLQKHIKMKISSIVHYLGLGLRIHSSVQCACLGVSMCVSSTAKWTVHGRYFQEAGVVIKGHLG